MSIFSNTHLQLAVSSLRRNRARTFLSAFGIAIGVASIVTIMSLTGGINRLIGINTDKANANLILVRPSNGKQGAENIIGEITANNQYAKSNLTLEDLNIISDLDNVSAVAPIASTTAPLVLDDKSIPSINIVATTADLPDTTPLPLKNGSFFAKKKIPEGNTSNNNNTAVIGSSLANKIFGTTDVITSTLKYKDHKFIIVGVLDKLDDPINYNGVDFDNSLLIDINYASSFEESIQIQQLNVRSNTTDATATIADGIKTELSKRKNGDSTFQVLTSNTSFQASGSMFSVISGMLTLVAGIALFIGGIGIMNIMLVTVSERTREIGIRKAVGASACNIMLQFLLEAIILSIIGGLLGILLGYAGAFLISLITPFKPYISVDIILITSLTSLITGVVFGIYPAIKASIKDPITSLKDYH